MTNSVERSGHSKADGSIQFGASVVLNEEDRQRLLSEAAKLRARARKQVPAICFECHEPLVGLTRLKFCGQTHQRRNWRRRRAERKPGEALPPPVLAPCSPACYHQRPD